MSKRSKTNNKEDKVEFKSIKGLFTTKNRSHLMSRIKGKNTRSELLLRKSLWHLKIRYRKNDPRLPGRPDIAIPSKKLAIFIDGEFWHGHDWHMKKEFLRSNKFYWIQKIETNMGRDKQNNEDLIKMGWRVLRFWDNQVKKEFGACLKLILNQLDDENF